MTQATLKQTERAEALSQAGHAQAKGFNNGNASADGIVSALSREVKSSWDLQAMLSEAKHALESLKHAPTIRCGVCGRQESTASQAFFLNGQPACSSCFADAHKEWLRSRRKATRGARG